MNGKRLLKLVGIFLLVVIILALVQGLDIYFGGNDDIGAAVLTIIHGAMHMALSIAPQIIAAFLLLFFVWLVIHVSLSKSTLVLEGFSNGVGVQFSDEDRDGLCAAAHAQLLNEMQDFQHQLAFHHQATRALGALGKYSISLPILTKQNIDTEMSAFSAALTGALSDNWKWLGTLLDVLFRPGRITVKGTLEYVATFPRIAIIFEVSETYSKDEPTIYEVSQTIDPSDGQVVRPPKPSASYYYTTLLPRAARSLTRELLKRRMIDNAPPIYRLLRLSDRYRAEVCDFFGLLEQQCCKEDDGFYFARAVADFRQAINTCEDWYQPFANLADTLSVEGQRKLPSYDQRASESDNDRQEGRALQEYALDEYHEARTRLNRQLTRRERFINWYAKRMSMLRDTGSLEQRQSGQLTLLRLGEYRAKALAGDLPHELFIEAVKRLNHQPKQEGDVRILYYTACCYGLAYGLSQHESPAKSQDAQACGDTYRAQAVTYLAYSLARICLSMRRVPNAASLSGDMAKAAQRLEEIVSINDPGWYYWQRAETDPDLASLQDESLVNALKTHLRQELEIIFQPSSQAPSFVKIVDKAISQTLEAPRRHVAAADLRWSALEFESYEVWSESLD